jgi:O-antigen/teichoic acid export membrane protein
LEAEQEDLAVALSRLEFRFRALRLTTRHLVSGREGWALLDQGLVSATNFITNVVVARWLGMERFGVFALAWMAVLFCFNMQIPLVTAPLITVLPKLEADARRTYLGGVIAQELGFVLCCNAALLAGLRLLAFLAHKPALGGLTGSLCLATSAYLLQDLARRYLFASGQSRRAFLNDAVSCLPQLPLIFLLLRWKLIGVPGVLCIIGFTSFAGVGLCIYWCETVHFSFRGIRNSVRRHWKLSKWLVPSSILSWVCSNFIVLLAPVYYGPLAAGALRASQNIVGVTNIWILGLDNVLPAESSRSYHQGGTSLLKRYLWHAIFRWGGLTAAIVLVIGFAPGFWLHITYGLQYAAYGNILRMYVILCLFVFIGAPLRAGLQAMEHTSPFLLSQFAAAIFALAVGVPLTRRFGLQGVLIGTIGTTIIMHGILFGSLINQLKIRRPMIPTP